MPIYSFSQIQKYISCPLSYRFRYVDKIIPDFEENLHLILGTEVHSSLEYLYKQVNNFKTPKYKDIENYFINNFKEKADKLENSKEEIDEFLTRGKQYLKNFYNKHFPFEDIKVIGTEIKLYIELNDKIKFQGYIDRLDKKLDSFILTDYKTNKNLPEEDKSYYEEQLTLYALGVKQKYGKYFKKIYGNLEYLHFDIQDLWEIKNKDIDRVRQKYIDIVQEIEQKKVEFNLGNEDSFPTKESNNCKFCEYKEICPLFSHFFGKVNYNDLGEETIKNIIDEYVQLAKQKNEIEKRLKENKAILEEFVKDNKLKQIYGNKYSIKISILENYKILDKEKLKEILKDKKLLEEVLDIDKTKLKKIIKEKKLQFDIGVIKKSESLVFRGK